MKDLPPRDWRGRFAVLTCVNAHDRCYYGPDDNCPYCELRVKKKLDTR